MSWLMCARRQSIDPALYSWKGYRDWTDKVRRNWTDEESDDEVAEDEDEAADQEEDTEDDDTEDDEEDDRLAVARRRAEEWAARAIQVSGLINKPRSKKGDAQREYEAQVARAAEKLAKKVVP